MAEAGLEREVIDILSLIEKKQNFLLSGGAGSGKTYSLVSLLKKVSEKYPKVRIACITYTNAAALEIRDRCHIGNLYVSTIHDFLWDNIRQFQVELRKILCEIVNDPNGKIQNPLSDDEEEFQLLDDIQITYKEYTRILKGEISHDEVLIIAKKMFETYPKLCKIVCSKYPFIFVDEYQDTSPLVIEILLQICMHILQITHSYVLCFKNLQGIQKQNIDRIRYHRMSLLVLKELYSAMNLLIRKFVSYGKIPEIKLCIINLRMLFRNVVMDQLSL